MITIVYYILAIILVSTVISLGSNIKRNREIKKRIETNWGEEIEEKYSEDDLNTIAEYFNNKKNAEGNKFFIDEITWNDLSMDSIFKKINTTESSPGEQCLYNILREPLFNEQELKQRNKLINFFDEHKDERKKIQYMLAKLGKKRSCLISDYFYNKDEKIKSNLMYYRILAAMPFICIGVMFLNAQIGVIAILTAILVNMYTYYRGKMKLSYKLESFKYIVQIIKYADLILKEDIKELESYNVKLKESFHELRSIKNVSFNAGNNGTDVGIMNEYIGILLLRDLINYEKMSDMLKKKSNEFKIIFEVIGTIDSLIAIASYRKRVNYYVTPELTKCINKQEQISTFKDMIHPLIKKSIPNSLEMTDSILITGSNASGKSTFLKTLAINIIFAQTIYTCLAKEFKCCYFKIYTSMALKDDIFNKESYYIVETRSLKRIIDGVNEEIPTICFVDEILRGTNTIERISASSQVLKYLTLNNCICVAATHDVELTHILEKYFTNYHFQEEIENNEITFDYKMYNGRSTTQNAIKLLGILGYNDTIVQKAQAKADKFLNDGVWEAE